MKNTRKSKSYRSIWNVSKVLYSLGDINLPMPVTFSQIGWFVTGFMFMLIIGDALAFIPFLDGMFVRQLVIPIALAAFMSKKTFDGKNPYQYFKSLLLFIARSKTTYRGQAVKRGKRRYNEEIAFVTSTYYVVDKKKKKVLAYDINGHMVGEYLRSSKKIVSRKKKKEEVYT